MINQFIKQMSRITNYQDRKGCVRLDMNENPCGLPESFVSDVLKEVTPEFLSMYPNHYEFKKTFAEYYNLGFDNVQPTNGSDMAIRLLFDIFVNPGSNVLGVSPSFEMYRINAEMHGAKYVPIRYNEDLTLDVKKIVDLIDNNTSVVVILNPNNPISNIIDEKTVRSIIEKAHLCEAIVLIDEAYIHFASESKSYINLINEYDNVVILRTFSKLFSIAALRLGVIISNADIIRLVFNTQPSFDVNSISLLFGTRILQNQKIISDLINDFMVAKQLIIHFLRTNGYTYYDGNANFVLFKPKHATPLTLSRKFSDSNILVKTYSDPILEKYIRISFGNKSDLVAFCDLLLQYDVVCKGE